MKKFLFTLALSVSCFGAQACTPFDKQAKGITTGSVHSPVVIWISWWCPPEVGKKEWTKGKGAVWIPSYYASAKEISEFHDAVARKDVAWMESKVNLSPDDPQILRSIASPEARAKQLAAKPKDYARPRAPSKAK